MMRRSGPGDGTPSLESLRELRLRALLNDLVHDLGPVKAAEQLGIDRKTLWRSEGAGEMSPRLIEALERLLLERAAADGERVRALEERVARLERELAAALVALGSGSNGGDGGARWSRPCGRSSPRIYSGWSGGWNGWNQCGALCQERRVAGPGPVRYAVSGVTPTWWPGSPPMTMSQCTERPGLWWTNGGGCGPGIRPRAGAWPGCRLGSGSWSWKWRCWRSTA